MIVKVRIIFRLTGIECDQIGAGFEGLNDSSSKNMEKSHYPEMFKALRALKINLGCSVW